MSKTAEPVDLFCISGFKHDGRHFAVGDVLPAVEADLAKELAGNGRARLATAEEASAAKPKPKPNKAEAATA